MNRKNEKQYILSNIIVIAMITYQNCAFFVSEFHAD